MAILRDALEYHATPTAGKISVVPPSLPHQRDSRSLITRGRRTLLEIERDPNLVYKYTPSNWWPW